MKHAFALVLALSLPVFSGCASIVSGSKQELSFQSTPDGASVTVNGRIIGKTPITTQLDKKADQTVVFSKDGYKPVTMQLTTSLDPWFWGNIVLGGLIGSTVDGLSGAVHQYAPSQYFVTLDKENVSQLEAPMSRAQDSKVKDFIVARYRSIVADVHKGGGENSDALMSMLNVPKEKKDDALRKVRALSDAFTDAPQFADQVIAAVHSN